MTVADMINRIGHIRQLEVQLSELYANPKLTAKEANYLLDTLDCIREYSDVLERNINKKVKELYYG